MKNLLFVMDSLENNGAVASLINLLSALDYNKYTVDLFVLNHKYDFFKNQLPNDVNLLPKDDRLNYFFQPLKESLLWYVRKHYFRLAFLKILVWLLSKVNSVRAYETIFPQAIKSFSKITKKYDAVIAYNDFFPWVVAVECVDATETIGWNHSIYDSIGYSDRIYGRELKKLDKIVTISEICKDSLIKHFQIDDNKIFIIENIINKDRIVDLARKKVNFAFNKNEISLMSIGRLHFQKGYDIFIEALSKIHVKWKWHFYIIGDGPDRESLLALIERFALNDNITLLGPKENPYPYLSKCDIYVQPSRFEGYGIAIDEAIALNKPVLATDTVRERFDDGKNILLCECNAKAWKMLLEKVFEDISLLKVIESGTYDVNLDRGIQKFYKMLGSKDLCGVIK